MLKIQLISEISREFSATIWPLSSPLFEAIDPYCLEIKGSLNERAQVDPQL